ncbi:hypothetical protein pb186bvf_006110 [Paramecium bursaria]
MYLESTGIVHAIIDIVVDRAAQQLYENYLESKESTHNANAILVWNLGVVQQEFLVIMPFQHSPTIQGRANLLFSINGSMKMSPKFFKTIDNMTSKGVKIQRPPEPVIDDSKSLNQSSKTSSRLLRSVSKVKLMNRLGNSSQPTLSKNASAQQVPDEPEFKCAIQKVGEEKRPPTPDPIIDRLREQRELHEKDRQRENERMRKLKEQQQEQEERQKEQQKQLRNKQYTYEFDGQIVFLTTKPVDLCQNDVLQPDAKTGQPLKIIKEITQQPETKPVRETFIRGEDEKKNMERAQAVEYPKQPPIVEALKPKQGTNIIFDNGYVKEGGDFRVANKISKKEYENLLDGQVQQKKPQYEVDDEIKEEVDTYQQRLKDNLVKKDINRQIKILNENHYLKMLEDESLRRLNSSRSRKSDVLEIVSQPQESPKQIQKIKYDRINAYKQFEDFKGKEELKTSKLHKAVKEFDKKIIDNPYWGYVESSKEPQIPNSTIYKLKHNKSSGILPRIKK